MGRWIAALSLTGWAGIVALAYGMADARISLCGDGLYSHNRGCILRATEARDSILLIGLAVALVAALLILAVRARRVARPTDWMPTNRAWPLRLR